MRLCHLLFKNNSPLYLSLLLGLALSFYLSPYFKDHCSLPRYVVRSLGEGGKGGEEYEPRINLAGKPVRAKKVPQNVIRPRYYSSELGIREKLLVGVLTTESTIRSLAIAINKTSAHLVDRIMFFIDAKSAERANVISLKLPGIVGFVDARQIFKPFHVLKYLTDNFVEEYDFFFLVKDTTYLDAKALHHLVKHLSVSQEIHAGPARIGTSAYCSLDGGVLLSNSVLRKVQSALAWCVKSTVTDSDSENVGRCILHASNIPCVNQVQSLTLERTLLPETNQEEAIMKSIPENSITYYPVTTPKMFYQLHFLLSKRHLSNNKKELVEVKRGVDINTEGLSWPAGSYPPKSPPSRFDILRWDYFDMDSLYLPSASVNKHSLSGSHLTDVQNVVNKSVDWLVENYHGKISYRRLVNGYRRFDPSRGLDYILDLAFRDYRGREIIKRVEVCKALGRVEILPMPYVTESSRVSIVLAVHAEYKDQVVQFIQSYAQICMQTTELTFLLLVLIYEPNAPGKGHSADVFKEIKEMALMYSSKYHMNSNKIAWLSVRVPEVDRYGAPLFDQVLYFGIIDLSLKKLPPDSLVLIAEPNMEIRLDYFNRVRMNTILGTQVYSSIPFREWEVRKRGEGGGSTSVEITKTTGHFDTTNTRHLSFYPADYIAGRSLMRKELGEEVKSDKEIARLVSNYEKHCSEECTLLSLFRRSGVVVLRSVEPALRLHFDPLRRTHVCPKLRRLEEKTLCHESVTHSMGSRTLLASHILNITN